MYAEKVFHVLSFKTFFCSQTGEVGREMYIVDSGKLHVLSEDGTGGETSVLATLMSGAYFGEISLLNMDAAGNRRTASVISVGYTQLLCLSKKNISEVCFVSLEMIL